MISDNPGFTDPAMDVIRRTDPATWSRMNATPWHVHVIVKGDETSITDYEDTYGAANAFELMQELEGAYGVTMWNRANTHPLQLTFINVPGIRATAKRLKVPAADFLADVMVHEFAHDAGARTEPPAFAAGTAFALKLPPSDAPIARESRRDGRAVARMR